jgi:hypothetical protein
MHAIPGNDGACCRCGPADLQLACEVGDLSSKGGQVDLLSMLDIKVRHVWGLIH